MCKTLLFRYLLLSFALLGVSSVIAQEFAKSHPDRTIDFHQQVQERLFSTALSQMDISELSSLHLQIKKDQVISLLNTRYPELVYELENTPEQIISEKEISKLLLTIIKEESSFGNLDLEGSLWESAQSSIADSEGIATLEFLFGYELFKQKRLKEAQKNFQRLAKMRKGPYEYALYYGGLSSLLNKEFPEAINQLKAIGKEEALKPHISYYLSAAHYGNGDFTSVIKYFENRIQDQKLFNIEGITQIVAYSNYHLNRYEAAINNFNILSQYRNLSEDEKYILGKALLKTGQNIEGNSLLSEIAVQSQESKLKQSASYEYALNLSKEGKYEEAKSMFISMLSDDQYQKEDLQYNIAILHAKTGNYNNATKNALALIKGKYQKEVLSLLSDMIDHIENPSTYIAVVEAIDLRAQDKSVIKSSLYKKAIIALQAGNFSTANSYFEKLKTIDPLIEERGAVAAWKGIMAYKDGDFKSAQKLLANYLNSKPTQETTISINRELEFYAHYFLAYSSFKLKDHKNALGHFSKSLAIVTNPSDKNMIEDIQLRIGDSYFLMVQYDQAKKSYDVAESLDQSYRPYALWQKAVIAELQNELYDQLLILDDIIGTHPESKYFGRAAFSAANTLFALGKYDKSATLYKRLESEDVPNRMKEEAIVQLGLISVNAGAYDVAETYYHRIIQSSKDKELQHRAHLALKEIYADYTYDTDAYLNLIKTEDNNDQSTIADEVIFELAMRNFEAANYTAAISQWNKLINEYSESNKGQEAQFQIAISFQKQEEMTNAMDAYRATTQYGASEWCSKAYDQMEGIAFSQNKDYKLYLQLLEDRKHSFPSYTITTLQTYNAALSALSVGDLNATKLYTTALFELNDISLKEKTTILSKANELFMKNKQWRSITELASLPNFKQIIDTSPKYIYTRSLAFMNQSKLDKAAELITESYSELLNDPAWLAKSIILLADIYTLKGDKDSAVAALQALIETKSEVPSSLIDMAKNRLDFIKPQN